MTTKELLVWVAESLLEAARCVNRKDERAAEIVIGTIRDHLNDERPAKTSCAINRCRVCGCTDDNACPGGCSWVEPDLCSKCA